MSRNKLTLLIGILLVLMPFLGFPSSWKTFFYVIFGFIFIIMAIVGHVRRRAPVVEERSEVITQVFVAEDDHQA